jgi:DNA-binding MarR family transcriptional regulator
MPGRLAIELQSSKPISNQTMEAYLNLLRTADRLRRVADALMKPYDLSETSYNVLRILRGAQPDGLPCGAISERLLTVDPDVTRLVDRLERRSLVDRARSTSDRRVVQVHITASGLALLEEMDLDHRLTAALSPYFERIPSDLLHTFIEQLESLRQEPQGTIP